MFMCSKEYQDIPFAHRQPNHEGHCRLIHGHNWGFRFTFVASELDVNGFVLDFGQLKSLKATLEKLDHALVLNNDDPIQPAEDVARVVRVPSASSEGLAEHFGRRTDATLRVSTEGRVRVWSCHCMEDSRNSATWLNSEVHLAQERWA